jgi:hypothetical protein
MRIGLLLVSLFCCCALSQSLNATLLIALRDNDVLYVASDGLISVTGQNRSWKYLKCFPASKTGCVAITGYGGANGSITTTSNQLSFTHDFPPILDKIATEEFAKQESFSRSLTNTLSRFAIEYKSLMELLETNTYLAQQQFDDTDIYFMGYDPTTATFYNSEAHFHPIAPYKFDLNTVSIPASTITFKGEFAFLSALMRGDDPRLKALRSEAFDTAFPPDSSAGDGLQAKAISDRILRLFALHTEYSKRYNYDHGLVGPPYVVYRISTNDVKRVYYGNGFATSDEKFVNILIILIVLLVIVGVIILGYRA